MLGLFSSLMYIISVSLALSFERCAFNTLERLKLLHFIVFPHLGKALLLCCAALHCSCCGYGFVEGVIMEMSF